MLRKTQILATLLGTLAAGQAAAADTPLSIETEPHFVKTEMYGRVLVGKDDAALYTFKKDFAMGGLPPKCTTKADDLPLGSCLKRWPAATISYDDFKALAKKDPSKPFGVVYNQEVGQLQLTYDSLPLYYWFGDKPAEQTNFTGLGVNAAWDLKSLDKTISYEGDVTAGGY